MDIRTALSFAYALARQSPDPSTQNGAIILNERMTEVLGQGKNTFPQNVMPYVERLERPLKYEFIEHAERNAIYDAAWSGKKLLHSTMVCPWFACSDCARGIIQSGIAKVIGHKKMFDATPDRWQESIATAFTMFEEAGVETVMWEGTLGGMPVLQNGEFFVP